MKVQLEPLTTPAILAMRTRIVLVIWAVILMALPMWWKTTEVYRAELPYASIRSWNAPEALTLQLKLDIHLHLVHGAAVKTGGSLASITRQVESDLNSIFREAVPQAAHGRQASLQFSVAGSADASPAWSETESVETVDQSLAALHGENSHYHVYVGCGVKRGDRETVYVGKHRALFIGLLENACTADAVVDRATRTIGGLFGSEQKSLIKLSADRQQQDTDHKSMRTVKYAPEYQIVLSLLVGDPEDAIVTWDIEEAAKAYLSPFLETISNISDVQLTSQILNYAPLPITPEGYQQPDGSNAYFLNPKALTNFINSAEWNLASVVSSAQPINLIVYIPPAQQSPLYVQHSDGSLLKTNAFLIPQWGGIIVKNTPQDMSRLHYTLSDLHPMMEVFVAQLRGLFGVDPVWISSPASVLPNVDVQYAIATDRGLTGWETDRLFRARTVQNMVNAVKTLTSLANLLEQLENMVVLDHIQTLVTRSLDSLGQAKDELRNKQSVKAIQHARDAVTSAEAAFFDPSMVPLLYFPEEHKFAVYMPYFVPVSVPLIVALLVEIKTFIQARKAARAKKSA
ncbi:phosphatidylinositol-glycan biosynthesis class S protein [Entophlyctis helioformis]|nr:phosphatidylinositol-glycan biosynthesis class S protein [Entophlyctis helioformis]